MLTLPLVWKNGFTPEVSNRSICTPHCSAPFVATQRNHLTFFSYYYREEYLS